MSRVRGGNLELTKAHEGDYHHRWIVNDQLSPRDHLISTTDHAIDISYNFSSEPPGVYYQPLQPTFASILNHEAIMNLAII